MPRGRLDATLSGHNDLGILMVIRESDNMVPKKSDTIRSVERLQQHRTGTSLCGTMQDQCSMVTLYGGS